jgi:hypothetical protein
MNLCSHFYLNQASASSRSVNTSIFNTAELGMVAEKSALILASLFGAYIAILSMGGKVPK